ncbi:neuferricin [Schistocerca piceifrons]|uniref:neuferricin n=1 Tax=Schistocerca piceifrons TaxID=274613 RepID=UPI001F5E377A|nr:neuferricin [Schistocerca piceifrons]
MNAKNVFLVSFLITAVAFYLHEYHLSTLVSVFKFSPYLNSVMISVHNVLLTWFGSVRSQEDLGVKNNQKSTTVFTLEDLKKFNGERGLYLSIMGKVYDVGKENKHYKAGADYHFFTGRDASRAFVTGEFTESGLIDEVLDLSPEELKSLSDWAKFYQTQYKYKGKLLGRYYDADGKATPYLREVQKKIKQAKAREADTNKLKLMFPPCNVEWSHDTGSRVWCSTRSGGIERDWVGSPRQFYEPGSSAYRCACINMQAAETLPMLGNIREYEDCDPHATSCHIKS